MKVKYIDSIVLNLPDYIGHTSTLGGLNTSLHIHWYKTDCSGNFVGLEDNEALDLLNFLKTHLKRNITNSTIKEIEEEDVPFIPFSLNRNEVVEYELSKVIDYTDWLNFHVLGYFPTI